LAWGVFLWRGFSKGLLELERWPSRWSFSQRRQGLQVQKSGFVERRTLKYIPLSGMVFGRDTYVIPELTDGQVQDFLAMREFVEISDE
jgi:hypothetical protein